MKLRQNQALKSRGERFVRQVSHAGWAVFAKNGNDATRPAHAPPVART